jgi:hypothetical protein
MSRTAKWFIPALAFGLLLGLAGEQTRAQDENKAVGTVSGTVKGQDGEAAAEVNVRIVSPPKGKKGGDAVLAPADGEKKKRPKPVAQGKTDADGKFTIENVPVGSYMVVAGGGGKGMARQAVEVKEGETASVELQLAPNPKAK